MHLIARLLRDQGGKHAWGYVLAFVMMGITATATTLSAYMMKFIVNRIFLDRDIVAMWEIGGAITAIYIAKGFATYGQQVTLSRISNNIIADSQTKIFDKMLAMDVSFYNARHSAEFLARQAFISQSAGNALNILVTAFGRDALTTLGLTFAMFQQDAAPGFGSLDHARAIGACASSAIARRRVIDRPNSRASRPFSPPCRRRPRAFAW